jgi:hypothetical protein
MSELLNLSQLLVSLGQPPVAFEQLVKFVAFASRLKNDILLAQPATFDPASDRCPILPLTIQEFLKLGDFNNLRKKFQGSPFVLAPRHCSG